AALRARAGGSQDSPFAVEWVARAGQAAAGSGPASANGAPRRAALLGAGAGAELDAAGIELERHPDLAALERAVADGAPAPELVVVRAPAADPDGPLAEAVHAAAARTLALLQTWL